MKKRLSDASFAVREERSVFFRVFMSLMIPSVIQSVVSSSLYIVDNLMIGNLGPDALAAVTQANQLSMIMTIFLFGVVSGASIFASQYWGKQDLSGIHSVLGIAMTATFAISLIGFSVATFFPRRFMVLFVQDEAVIELGMQYLGIIRFAYLFQAITIAFSTVNKSTERVRLPMMASILSLATNTALNYCLIFGNFFFPQMGLPGGALASTIAAGVECVTLVGFTYILQYPASAHPREFFTHEPGFIRGYIKTAWPVVFNEGLWGLGTSVFAAVYGTMGTVTLAAVSISGTIDRFMYMIVVGVVHASGIMVGKSIGSGDKAAAYRVGKRALMIGTGIGCLSAAVIALLRMQMIGVFNMPEEVTALASNLVLILAAGTTLRSYNYVSVVGVLRAGGDTVFSLCLDLGGIWLLSVPLVCITGLVFDWPIVFVAPLIYAEDVAKFVIGLIRFRSKKWMRNLVGTGE